MRRPGRPDCESDSEHDASDTVPGPGSWQRWPAAGPAGPGPGVPPPGRAGGAAAGPGSESAAAAVAETPGPAGMTRMIIGLSRFQATAADRHGARTEVALRRLAGGLQVR